jgi:hypothetical protein
MSVRSRRTLRWGLGALVVAFLAAQLVRPALPTEPAGASLDAPPEVVAFLERSCFDCHSNQTRLPWFDRIAPAYWLVAADVREGRAHLNFSDLAAGPAAAQRGALWESVNHVRLGAMPPWRYTLVHRDAVPAPAEVDALERWLVSVAPHPAPGMPADAPPAPSPAAVRPAPNGLAFEPGFRDWRVVSSTDRFDNATMRQILGNDVAIRAIEQGAFPPWPDGTMFAKLAWQQVAGDDGVLRAGPWVQVELMVKDATRFASTAGWGWGRWKGETLEPFGADASFTDGCVGCHAPVADADFVYTLPIDRRPEPGADAATTNGIAALRGALPVDPLQWRVVAMELDPNGSTMSTLFGDDAGDDAARALVTWQRRDDPNWFGARIPAGVVSVELVRGDDYARFEGAPLRATAVDPATAAARRRDILGRRPLRSP